MLGGVLFAMMLVIGPPQDALFGFVLLANLLIGVGQELRAKHAVDRLSVIAARRATVWRDGAETTVPLSDIVTGDVIEVVAGDQSWLMATWSVAASWKSTKPC